MNYENLPVPKIKTMEMLRTEDITEIVLRDLERYNVPTSEWGTIMKDYISPLRKAVEELIKKTVYENKAITLNN